MAATGAKERTMHRSVKEPGGRSQEDARGGVPSCMRASLAPQAGLLSEERPAEEHCRAPRRRLSGESRLRAILFIICSVVLFEVDPVRGSGPADWVHLNTH